MTGTMPDTIHANVNNINPNGPFTHVAGYTSGTPDIMWTAADWSRFPRQHHIRIEQGYGGFTPNMSDYDVLDIETGAWTPETAANEVERRVLAGYTWTTLYGNDTALSQTASLIKAKGDHIWIGHVDCVLADWNLNEAEAAAIVGTMVHGMTCQGVQWASPSSNPNTNLPGTSMTLSQGNVDLNVVNPNWNPSTVPVKPPVPVPPTPVPPKPPVPPVPPTPVPPKPPVPPVPPTPVPPTPVVLLVEGVVCFVNSAGVLEARDVASHDGGLTWADVTSV